eukprot:2678-Rhodomonas_salina.2
MGDTQRGESDSQGPEWLCVSPGKLNDQGGGKGRHGEVVTGANAGNKETTTGGPGDQTRDQTEVRGAGVRETKTLPPRSERGTGQVRQHRQRRSDTGEGAGGYRQHCQGHLGSR